MPLGFQGTLNKPFVSAIQFLDQREINPNLIDQSRDRAFTDIMKIIGRYKETKVPIYNYFVNNDVFADSVVTSVSSGYGTAIITIVLTAATSGYARVGDVASFSNTNDTQGGVKKQGIVQTVNTVSGVDTVKIQSVDNSPLYAATNDTIGWVSNAYGEGSGNPVNRKYGMTRYINQVQIFKETDIITDIQKGSKIEVTVNGQPYYLPYSHIQKVNYLNGVISAQMILGNQSITLFADANPYLIDASSNAIQTTMGLDQYINTYGASTSVASIGTLGFTDLNSMIDAFLANKAPNQQMGFSGSKARRPWDVFFKNLGSAGVTSVRMVIDGKSVDLEVDHVSYGNFDFDLIHLPIVDHPQLFNPTVLPEIVGSIYWVPKDKVEVVGGGLEGRLQIRYMNTGSEGQGANTYSNGIISEWRTGALAPIPTTDAGVLNTYWKTIQGLEALGVKHFQKFRIA